MIEQSEATQAATQAAERQSVRQLQQAEEAKRSITEQLDAAAAEAALETALQNRQVELEDARAELGAVSSEAQIASSLLAAEIGGLEAQCEHKIRHSRELAMSRRPAARM